MVLILPSSQCQWRHLQPSQGAAHVPALGRDLGISARIGDLRHQQNSRRSQKSYSAQGNTHRSELESSKVPDKFYSAIIYVSEPKPTLLSREFTPTVPGMRAGAASPPFICFSNLNLPKGGGKPPCELQSGLTVLTSNAGPAGRVGTRRKPQLLFVCCPHGDSQETTTRSSPWGAVHVLPVLPAFPHAHGKSPLTGN